MLRFVNTGIFLNIIQKHASGYPALRYSVYMQYSKCAYVTLYVIITQRARGGYARVTSNVIIYAYAHAVKFSVHTIYSDNGAWMEKGLSGGSNGLLRGQKGETWEGGMRYRYTHTRTAIAAACDITDEINPPGSQLSSTGLGRLVQLRYTDIYITV